MNTTIAVIFGLSYTLIYFVLAFWANSGDSPANGTSVFLTPIYSWPLVVISLMLLTDLSRTRNRVFFLAAMLSHYFLLAIAAAGNGDYFGTIYAEYIKNHYLFAMVANGWYLLGQAFLWVTFFFIVTKKTET